MYVKLTEKRKEFFTVLTQISSSASVGVFGKETVQLVLLSSNLWPSFNIWLLLSKSSSRLFCFSFKNCSLSNRRFLHCSSLSSSSRKTSSSVFAASSPSNVSMFFHLNWRWRPVPWSSPSSRRSSWSSLTWKKIKHKLMNFSSIIENYSKCRSQK